MNTSDSQQPSGSTPSVPGEPTKNMIGTYRGGIAAASSGAVVGSLVGAVLGSLGGIVGASVGAAVGASAWAVTHPMNVQSAHQNKSDR
jgi:uncharacterized protein YqgC (DUF456 family)